MSRPTPWVDYGRMENFFPFLIHTTRPLLWLPYLVSFIYFAYKGYVLKLQTTDPISPQLPLPSEFLDPVTHLLSQELSLPSFFVT